MANPQTTETTTEVLYGAVKIEVSSDSAFTSPVDIGAANGIKYTEEMKISTFENDNAIDRDRVVEQKGKIEFEQVQMLNESARAIMRGTLDTIVNIAGTPVTDHEQEYAANGWSVETFIPFDQISYSGVGGAIAVPTNIGLTQDTAGTPVTLTVDTDYIVGQGEDGRWGVFMVDSGTTDDTKDLEIEFDYTPKTATEYYTGGKSELPTFYVRLTNENEDGDLVVWETLGACNLIKGDEITFKKYNADDTRVPIPVEIQVRQDITLDEGKQLMKRTVTPAA